MAILLYCKLYYKWMCSALKIVVDLPMFSLFFFVFTVKEYCILVFSGSPFLQIGSGSSQQLVLDTWHTIITKIINLWLSEQFFFFLRFQCTCRRGFHCTFQSSLAAQQWLKIFLCYRLNLENVLFLQEKIYIFFLFFFFC